MKWNLKTLIVYVFQALIILVPLTWTPATSELFEFPKMLLTYVGATLIAGLWVARMIVEKRIIFKRSFFEIPLLLFFLSQALSTLKSIDLHTSLFGYYSRFNGGLFSIISYLLLYFAAVSNFTKKDVVVIIKTLVISAILASLYAFPEHFGHSPSCQLITGEFTARCWVQDVQTRVFGTFGQPNWLAAYLITIIFISLSQLVQKPKNQVVYWTIFTLFFLVLLFTKSKSGLLGFGVGFVVFAVLSLLTQKSKQAINALAIGTLLVVISFFLFGKNISGITDKIISSLFPQPISSVTESPAIPPVANSLDVTITPSSDIRRIVWQGALELANKNPLFGTGVETFAYSYYNVRPVEHNLVSEWNFLYNKAHNEFLNYAATTGYIGLATYIIFLGSFVVWVIKRIFESKGDSQIVPTTHIALLSGFIALSISNFFGFSTVPVQILLFLFPALGYLLSSSENTEEKSSQILLPQQGLLVVTGIIVFATLLKINSLYSADIFYKNGKSARESRDYQQAINDLQQAVKTSPKEALYTDELALTASEVAQTLATAHQVEQASQAAAVAVELSNQTLALNDVHLNFYKTRTTIFLNLSKIDPRFAIEAGVALDQAIRLAPTDARLWFNRAVLTKELGFPNEALGIYQKTLELKPNYEQARYQYAKFLEELGRTDEAKQQYEYILTRINPSNPQVQAALAEIATRSATKK